MAKRKTAAKTKELFVLYGSECGETGQGEHLGEFPTLKMAQDEAERDALYNAENGHPAVTYLIMKVVSTGNAAQIKWS